MNAERTIENLTEEQTKELFIACFDAMAEEDQMSEIKRIIKADEMLFGEIACWIDSEEDA
jgi:hypothetical protein